ncbi:hypothetical protein [Sporosarcina sp. P33]|uniref:hypothetical protein n=1 Tax=Sporosarcina sp. P33 TaxID=1930764 RepID=UPI0009BE3AA6|nr:hypothetical protein [Sporosarcina sp. P33]ARD47590.1 hypothetical protein SporoP33_04620 [Sporosarcina sp. P33]
MPNRNYLIEEQKVLIAKLSEQVKICNRQLEVEQSERFQVEENNRRLQAMLDSVDVTRNYREPELVEQLKLLEGME